MIVLERVLLLRRVPIFADLDTRQLGRLAASAAEISLPAGGTLFAAGDPGTSLYVIVEGQVRIHVDDTLLRVMGPADYIGEMAVLDGEPRSASATAETDALLLRIDRDAVVSVLEQHPSAALAVIRVLSAHLREREAELRALSSRK